MKKLYTAEIVAVGGREGKVYSPDHSFDMAIHKPKELGGSGEGTNPEQLLAAAWSACFLSALKVAGTQEGIDTANAEVTA